MAYITAFAITPYGAIERAWKPFNPILGETFELECGNQVRFLAEQVQDFERVIVDSWSVVFRSLIIHRSLQLMQKTAISSMISSQPRQLNFLEIQLKFTLVVSTVFGSD